MLDPVEDDVAPKVPDAPDVPEVPEVFEEDVPDDEADFDVYEASSPIRSNRDAWLGIAWVLLFTALAGWATHLYLDQPATVSVVVAPSATLGRMQPVGPAPLFSNLETPPPRKIKVSVAEPETLGGRVHSSEDKPQPPYYLKTFTDGTVVSGAYGELVTGNFVMMSAVTSALLLYPDSQLDVLLDHLQADDPNLIELIPVPAGTLGGVARCGSSKFADQPMAVCVWVAEQSIGIVTWIEQPLERAKEEFLPMREQIEHQL